MAVVDSPSLGVCGGASDSAQRTGELRTDKASHQPYQFQSPQERITPNLRSLPQEAERQCEMELKVKMKW